MNAAMRRSWARTRHVEVNKCWVATWHQLFCGLRSNHMEVDTRSFPKAKKTCTRTSHRQVLLAQLPTPHSARPESSFCAPEAAGSMKQRSLKETPRAQPGNPLAGILHILYFFVKP